MTNPTQPKVESGVKGWLDPLKFGVRVECAVCGMMKKPRGRSVGWDGGYCDDDCPGYSVDPQVGSLFPNESEADFGYEVGTVGVRYEGVER